MSIQNIFVIVLLFLNTHLFAVSNYEEGKKIYKNKCTSCHNLEKKMVGPPLKGVTQKYEEAWFIKWVTSSTAMIKTGDKRGVKIFNEYYKSLMTDNKDLTISQIKSIYLYLKNPN